MTLLILEWLVSPSARLQWLPPKPQARGDCCHSLFTQGLARHLLNCSCSHVFLFLFICKFQILFMQPHFLEQMSQSWVNVLFLKSCQVAAFLWLYVSIFPFMSSLLVSLPLYETRQMSSQKHLWSHLSAIWFIRTSHSPWTRLVSSADAIWGQGVVGGLPLYLKRLIKFPMQNDSTPHIALIVLFLSCNDRINHTPYKKTIRSHALWELEGTSPTPHS